MRRGDVGDSTAQTSTWGQFTRDRRGQSVVIGTVILFGFLVLALSLYQVQVVPQQNGGVEFDHYEAVQDDLIELRAGIATAGQADTPQFKTVQLGTAYPTRLIAINPPQPVGTLQTSDPYDIRISNETDEVTISTRFLKYDPGYNELETSPIWYDTSVLYVNARGGGGGIAVVEDQNLVTDNGTLRLTALQNTFQEDGTGRVTLELYPTESASNRPFPTGDLTVEVPTRLTGAEYWDDAGIPPATYEGVTQDAYATGVHKLTLDTTAETTRVNTVGIQSEPTEGAVKQNVGPSPGDGQDGGDGTDQSILRGTTVDTSNNNLKFQMENTEAGSIIIEEIGVDTTRITPGNTIESSTNSNEVDITRSTTNGQLRTNNQDQLQADGTTYDFKTAAEVNPGQGQYAEIAGGDEVTVDIQEFAQRLDNGSSNPLRFTTSAADADVTVTFVLSDGTEVPLYLEQS